jgi:CO dehydrogenase maturation factor
MKIAVVGKGGSGKSTVSWLLANYFHNHGKDVLAVDADYNMDFSTNLGANFDIVTKTICNCEDDFKKTIGMEIASYKQFVMANELPTTRFWIDDAFTNSLVVKTPADIKLILGGIGDEDILYSNKCGHAHLSPLKYYLPMLEIKQDQFVIIDSVAGLDMINFGLYIGCDAVVCVVENHPNSINVYNQISKICDRFKIPILVITNKIRVGFADKTRQKDLEKLPVIGNIPFDINLLDYKYSKELEKSLNLGLVFSKILKLPKIENSWDKLRSFDALKLGLEIR